MFKRLYYLGFISVTTLFFIVASHVIYADDTSLGRCSTGVYPIEHKNIQMVDEEVLIKVRDQQVICTFAFRNTGPTEKVLMGFPATYSGEYLEVRSFGEDPESSVSDFKTFIDGKEIPVNLETLAEEKMTEALKKQSYVYEEWYTFDVVIKKDETVKVVNTYSYQPAHTSMVPTEILEGYILDTGAAWKGQIGHGKIIFDLQGIPFTYMGYPTLTEYCRLEEGKLIYEFWDFEPTENIEFFYWDTRNWDEDYAKEIGSYDKVKEKEKLYEKLIDARSHEIQELMKEAIEREDIMSLLYLKSRNIELEDKERKPYLYNLSVFDDQVNIGIGDLNGDLNEVDIKIYDVEDQDQVQEEFTKKGKGYWNTSGFGKSFRVTVKLPNEVGNMALKIYAKDEEGNELTYYVQNMPFIQKEMTVSTKAEKKEASTVVDKEVIEASTGKAKVSIVGLTPREAGLTGMVIILFLTLVMQHKRLKE